MVHITYNKIKKITIKDLRKTLILSQFLSNLDWFFGFFRYENTKYLYIFNKVTRYMGSLQTSFKTRIETICPGLLVLIYPSSLQTSFKTRIETLVWLVYMNSRFQVLYKLPLKQGLKPSLY